MAGCDDIASDFYNLGFSTDSGLLTPGQYNTYVNDNINNNTDIGDGPEKRSILDHERCYLQGNLEEGGTVYTSGNFYKSSSMIEDLKSYADTNDPRNGNVCGQGKYIHSQIDPTTGEMVEECYDCGTPPPGKENLDYDITTRILTGGSLYSGELKVEEGSQTILGTVQSRERKDFEQDYTMYRYGIQDEAMLRSVTNEDGFLIPDEATTVRAISIYEEHGTEGTPPDKLDEATFLDVQKQCSPLISDWFPSQHSRNMNRKRSEIFDINTIDWASSNLLDDNPIPIVDFFEREYHGLLDDNELEEHRIAPERFNESNSGSILNHIRTLNIDTDAPLSGLQPEQLRLTHPYLSCDGDAGEGEGGADRCSNRFHQGIPEELARAWIAKKLDSIKKDELQTQQGNLGTLYGDLSNMFRDIDSSIENCINNIVGEDENGEDIINRIENARGDLSTLTQEDVHYLRRKIVRFIHSPDERIRECIDKMYLQGSHNLCTEGLYHKTLKILTVLFSLLSINLDLSDIETNNEKYNNVMNFIDSLGDLFPRAIEKIVRIIQDLEKDLCNTSNKSDIIVNLYDDLMNKNRVYNVDLGMFGKLFSMDDNQFSRIVDTYNMFSPILGRLFGPADNTSTT